ncbi:AAA family ATPase [Kordia sp.]|uniref:AAA family ATPase n=1 Tax=Kordia sp. TaxID=1965332 RepID=UPI003D2CA899
MSGFRLLAIIPLKGCSTDYRKNLEIGEKYKFYDAYDIELNEDKSSIMKVIPNINYDLPKNFIHLNNGIEVNISAIVGKNGSGKSTFFELLYLFIYLISINKKVNKEVVIDKRSKDLIFERYNIVKDIFKSQNKFSDPNSNKKKRFEILSLINKYNLNINYYSIKNLEDLIGTIKKELTDLFSQRAYIINKEKSKENEIKENLALSIIFEADNQVFEICYVNQEFGYACFKNGSRNTLEFEKDFSLEKFFYNISLNYSHHSLNSKISGTWITKLFHKNDGYITPVVINPMRKDGNFDINREIDLNKERLMINVVYSMIRNNETKLLNKYTITGFIFTPKGNNDISSIEKYTENISIESKSLLRKKLQTDKIENFNNYRDYALTYINNKIPKIKRNYKSIIFKDEPESDEVFQKFLGDDTSHITKKLRQTLKFLEMTNTDEGRKYWEVPNKTVEKDILKENFIAWLKLYENDIEGLTPLKLIEIAHPGFFNIDFQLETELGEKVTFGKLSSGEQQMIYNENTILYHLFNLQSVFNAKESRVKYQNINIILDEVELYYHPEMQQKLLNNLINSFETVKRKNEEGIKAVNIVLCTHSPFILSDIPADNILRLQEGKIYIGKDKVKSFGANIHDILNNDFFLSNGSMGNFAKEKIDEVIGWLYYKRLENEINVLNDEIEFLKEQEKEVNKLKYKILEDKEKELEKLKNIVELKQNYCKSLIQIIDEPLLKNTLNEMFHTVYTETKDEKLEEVKAFARRIGRGDIADQLNNFDEKP